MNYKQARKLAAYVANWVFDNELNNNVPNFKTSSNNPKFSDEMWAHLMVEAILSFNQGLEDVMDSRMASSNESELDLYNNAVDLVGSEAFNTIAFIVSAAGVRRPAELLGQASTLYMEAQNIARDTQAMEKGRSDTSTGYTRIWQIQQQLEEIGSSMKQISEQVGGYAADVQNTLNSLVTYSPQTGQTGLGMTGKPTGIMIQG